MTQSNLAKFYSYITTFINTKVNFIWKRIMQIYTILWDLNLSPTGHQCQVIQSHAQEGSCKNQGCRWVYKLASGRYPETEGECKDAEHRFVLPESTSQASRCVPNSKPAPQAAAQGQDYGVCQFAFSAVSWGLQPAKNCLPKGDPVTWASRTTGVGQSRLFISYAASEKLGHQTPVKPPIWKYL